MPWKASILLGVGLALAAACGDAAARPRPKPLFSYVGEELEGHHFSLTLTVDTSGRWEYRDHHSSGEGTLRRRDLRRFQRLLAAAPFTAGPRPCAGPRSRATYRDQRHDRVLVVDGACQEADAVTRQLVTCLDRAYSGSLTPADCSPP